MKWPSLLLGVLVVLFGACRSAPQYWTQPIDAGSCPEGDLNQTIRGVVVDEAGGFIEGAQVFYPAVRCQVLSDRDGRFELPLVQGADDFRVEVIGFEGQALEVVGGGSDVITVQLAARSLVRLTVTEAFSDWGERPPVLPGRPAIPGCFWVGGGEWGATAVNLRVDGLALLRERGSLIPRVPLVEHRWDDTDRRYIVGGSPPHWMLLGDTVNIRLAWYPDAGKTVQLAIGADVKSDSVPLTIHRWSNFRRWEERTAAVAVECSDWF
jgi:hypothetical protein